MEHRLGVDDLEKILNDHSSKYHEMYLQLSDKVTDILNMLDGIDLNEVRKLNSMLNGAQYESEEKNRESKGSYPNAYSDLCKRLNLRALGYFIKEGSSIIDIDETSFTEREYIAADEVESELIEMFESKENLQVEKIMALVESYGMVRGEVQFSLGMKVGAQLLLLLTSNSEYDF